MGDWTVDKVGGVGTDAEGVTKVALILTAKDATLVPEEGESVRHVAPTDLRERHSPGQEERCPLTERELECLRCLAEGMVYKAIAARMGLRVTTIRTHLHNIYGKLGVVDRAQAVLTAARNGWI